MSSVVVVLEKPWGYSTWSSGYWGNGDAGVSATVYLGDATVELTTLVSVTGVSATGYVGTVVIEQGCTVAVTGVQCVGIIGSVQLWSMVDTQQTPDWQQIAA